MPRIGGGGGGGPIVPPPAQGAGQAQGTNQAQGTQKTDFANQVAQAAASQGTEAARQTAGKQAAQSELTGKVKELARRFANGKMTQKEATREFVSLVIEERFPQFKKKKKKKKDDKDSDDEPQNAEERLEEAVTELIDRDPGLAKKLSSQFKKLAKG